MVTQFDVSSFYESNPTHGKKVRLTVTYAIKRRAMDAKIFGFHDRSLRKDQPCSMRAMNSLANFKGTIRRFASLTTHAIATILQL